MGQGQPRISCFSFPPLGLPVIGCHVRDTVLQGLLSRTSVFCNGILHCTDTAHKCLAICIYVLYSSADA